MRGWLIPSCGSRLCAPFGLALIDLRDEQASIWGGNYTLCCGQAGKASQGLGHLCIREARTGIEIRQQEQALLNHGVRCIAKESDIISMSLKQHVGGLVVAVPHQIGLFVSNGERFDNPILRIFDLICDRF
jgi:hypothetical protein